MGLFLSATAVSRPALEPTQPPMQWVPAALSLGLKWPGREADHSPPSSAQVKNTWSYTSTTQYVFMAWCLVKNSDNFRQSAVKPPINSRVSYLHFILTTFIKCRDVILSADSGKENKRH